MKSKYQLGLLHLVQLLISADGVVDPRETAAVDKLRSIEGITSDIMDEFLESARGKKERELYNEGIRLLNECSDEDKIKAFVHLYRISEVDNHVHVKEVRLLLYSVKLANIEFNDIVAEATKLKY